MTSIPDYLERYRDLVSQIIRLRVTKMHLSHLLVELCILALASGQEQLLMVFGGLNVYDPLRNVTLLSLDGGPPVPECLQNLSPAPKLLYSACQAALGEGK